MARRFAAVRAHTEQLAAALSAEDQCVQSMPDASPAKWHRAHTTWFFEQFVLRTFARGYQPFDRAFGFLFNSYYEAVGARHPRPMRGLLTRPSNQDVARYRAHVDAAVTRLMPDVGADAAALIELGLQHEQQHQELLLTDMLHAFAQNPLVPAVLPDWQEPAGAEAPTRFVGFSGGVVRIGHDGDGFCFDNETPAHRRAAAGLCMASRLVRNSEWLDFMRDGGYRTATLWMSDGWAQVQAQGWSAPLYWQERDGGWRQIGLGGLAAARPGRTGAPYQLVRSRCLCPLGRRAPADRGGVGNRPTTMRIFKKRPGMSGSGHPAPTAPIPAIGRAAGAVGEYNGKFMVNQMVLRGGSLATPADSCPARAIAISSIPTSAGSSPGCGSRATPDRKGLADAQ